MTFIDDAGSVEASQPREGISLRLPLVMHRIATGTRDIIIDGNKYTAGASGREEISLATSENEADLIIRLPMKHPVPQRWLAMGSPPKALDVSVYQKQLRSGEFLRTWTGFVTSMAADKGNTVALLRVPSRATALLDRRLPPSASGRLCSHILYDANCRVSRAGFTQDATVADVQGRVIEVSTMGAHPNAWADAGELLHVATGERMTIFTQTGVTITMQAPIPELQLGDAVQVFAGCPHDITSCRVLFDNRVNFGGFPQINTVNPLKPTGFGIYASE